MNLNVFLGDAAPSLAKIRTALERLVCAQDISFYETVPDLLDSLSGSCCAPDARIVVFAPGSEQELDIFSKGADQTRDLPLVLILPACTPDLIAKGHKLRPRAFFCGTVGPYEIVAVLGTMAGRIMQDMASGFA